MARGVTRAGVPSPRLTFNPAQAAVLQNKPPIYQSGQFGGTSAQQGSPVAIYVKSQQLGRYILVSQQQPLVQDVATPHGNVEVQFKPVLQNGKVSISPTIISNQVFNQSATSQQGNVNVSQAQQYTFGIQGSKLISIPVGQTSGNVTYQDQQALANLRQAQSQVSYFQNLINEVNSPNAGQGANASPQQIQNFLSFFNSSMYPKSGSLAGWQAYGYWQNQVNIFQAKAQPITLATIANGIITPSKNTISTPIYGTVNNSNQLLGNLISAPQATNGSLTLNPVGFQSSPVQISGNGYYASVNPQYNATAGTITINPINYNYVVGNAKTINLPMTTIAGQNVGGGTVTTVNVPSNFNANINYFGFQNVPVGVVNIPGISTPTILYEDFVNGIYKRSGLTPTTQTVAGTTGTGGTFTGTVSFNINPLTGIFNLGQTASGTAPILINGKQLNGVSESYNSATGYSLNINQASTPYGTVNLAVNKTTGEITSTLLGTATTGTVLGGVSVGQVTASGQAIVNAFNYTPPPSPKIVTTYQGADMTVSGFASIAPPPNVAVTSNAKITPLNIAASLIAPSLVTQPTTFTITEGGNSMLAPLTVSSITENITPLQALGQSFVIKQSTLSSLGVNNPLTELTAWAAQQGDIGALIYSPSSTITQRAEGLGIVGLYAASILLTGGIAALAGGSLSMLGTASVFGLTSAGTSIPSTVLFDVATGNKVPNPLTVRGLTTYAETAGISGLMGFITPFAIKAGYDFVYPENLRSYNIISVSGFKGTQADLASVDVTNIGKSLAMDPNEGLNAVRVDINSVNRFTGGVSTKMAIFQSQITSLTSASDVENIGISESRGATGTLYKNGEPIGKINMQDSTLTVASSHPQESPYSYFVSGKGSLNLMKTTFTDTGVDVNDNTGQTLPSVRGQPSSTIGSTGTLKFNYQVDLTDVLNNPSASGRLMTKPGFISLSEGTTTQAFFTEGEGYTAGGGKINIHGISFNLDDVPSLFRYTNGQGYRGSIISLGGSAPLALEPGYARVLPATAGEPGSPRASYEVFEVVPAKFQFNPALEQNLPPSLTEGALPAPTTGEGVSYTKGGQIMFQGYRSGGMVTAPDEDIIPTQVRDMFNARQEGGLRFFGRTSFGTITAQLTPQTFGVGQVAPLRTAVPPIFSFKPIFAVVPTNLQIGIQKQAKKQGRAQPPAYSLIEISSEAQGRQQRNVQITGQSFSFSPTEIFTNPQPKNRSPRNEEPEEEPTPRSEPITPAASPPPPAIPFGMGVPFIIPGLDRFLPQRPQKLMQKARTNALFEYIPDLASTTLGITSTRQAYKKLGLFRPIIKGGKKK